GVQAAPHPTGGTARMTEADLQELFDGAVDILAETLDPADARPYVLGLVLLRRLSDQFEERARAIEADTGDHARGWDDPDEHPLYVPAAARWSRLQAAAEDVGAVLNDA